MAAVVAFILAKNEEPNLGRCLEAVARLAIPTIVLDSGSTDQTRSLALSFSGVSVEPFLYSDHLTAYNQITSSRVSQGQFALILDADMVLTEGLQVELVSEVEKGVLEVGVAPVQMFWLGRPLDHGSLYPPKPILFRGGREYFEAVGHGERVVAGAQKVQFRSAIQHDDRKGLLAFLTSQVRYGRAFAARSQEHHLTWKDWVRLHTPVMVLASPLVSLFVRGGLFSGRVGLVYAIDRMLAELIQFRSGVLSRIRDIDDRL